MAMDPANPNIIYVGTGEGEYNFDAIQGAGIFKTTDGGGAGCSGWGMIAEMRNGGSADGSARGSAGGAATRGNAAN